MPDDRPMVLHARVVTGTGGGPEKTILNSPRVLRTLGYESLCAYMYPPGDAGFDQLRKRAHALDAPLVGVEDRGPFDFRVVQRLLKICRTHRVAIWHGHDYKSNVVGVLLRRFWPMKQVATAHGWVKFTHKTPVYHWIDRFCLRFCEKVICVSDDLYCSCLSARVSPNRCTLIRNAIDTHQFTRQTPTEQAKRRIGVDPRRLLVGGVGRLSEEKNFHGLIRAVHRLLDDGLDVELIIVGEGDQKAKLQRLIGDLGREDRIHLLGYRPDMSDLYQAMDVFALSSVREGLPNVLLEAMAMEVPVVATRVAGVPQLVGHETNGLLVEAGDLGQLAESLKRLLMDRDLRDRLAAAGRRTVEEHYSFEARMEKIRAIYDQLLGNHNETADAIS